MAKIIDIKNAKSRKRKTAPVVDSEAIKLMRLADEIDSVILKHLEKDNVDQWDIAGVLAHRLGTLLCHVEDKDKLWDVCEKVLKQQAIIK